MGKFYKGDIIQLKPYILAYYSYDFIYKITKRFYYTRYFSSFLDNVKLTKSIVDKKYYLYSNIFRVDHD